MHNCTGKTFLETSRYDTLPLAPFIVRDVRGRSQDASHRSDQMAFPPKLYECPFAPFFPVSKVICSRLFFSTAWGIFSREVPSTPPHPRGVSDPHSVSLRRPNARIDTHTQFDKSMILTNWSSSFVDSVLLTTTIKCRKCLGCSMC